MLFGVPALRNALRPVLRVYAQRPVRGALKLTAIAMYAGFLIVIGISSQWAREARQVAEEQRQAEERGRARLVALANDEVEALLRQAKAALGDREVERAIELLNSALKIEMAGNSGEASWLLGAIRESADPEAVRQRLVGLPEEDFEAFASAGVVPASFDFGYDVLTARAAELARAEFSAAREARIEERRIAEEKAARQRQEAQARAHAERRQREAEKETARRRREAAQKEVRDRLDAFMAALEAAEVTLVERVSVRRMGERGWEATLTAKDLWHLRHKQLRLQDAQALWEAWALIASPNDLDLARITIVDHRGNEVGGSRIWAGSLIWVQD